MNLNNMEEVNKNTELNNTDKKLHISDVINRLKRYNINGDGRYGHNRDSAYNEEKYIWIYEDKNGMWIKFDELMDLINGL